MSTPFTHHFDQKHPAYSFEIKQERFSGTPILDTFIDEARASVSAVEQFMELPERNQSLVLDMTRMMIEAGNRMFGKYEAGFRVNYWGLYIIGSRASEEHRTDSDLDLLSVGTFYRQLGFGLTPRRGDSSREDVTSEGFDIKLPSELPDEYNIGAVDRKYLVRANPEEEGVLPVDLNVVDLTFIRANLDDFLTKIDVDDSGIQLPRIPLVEVTVAQSRY